MISVTHSFLKTDLKSQDRISKRGVNWVLKIFLRKMPKLKLYAQIIQKGQILKCMLIINNKCKESKDREKQIQEFVIEVRLIAYVPALSMMT